ncbi:MAG: TIGR00341 family protein [Parvularculaceae bacterium]|nr:TIGR00341 family protein [Parvularculaceae bacterium]
MRLIEITFPVTRSDDVRAEIDKAEPAHVLISDPNADDQCVARVFFAGKGAQEFFDAIQHLCERENDWRVLVIPVEATAPKPEESEEKKNADAARGERALREEIYSDVADGAALSLDFFVLTLASTIVAAIGLNSDNVAAVIGAMVIAPLLGPILAVTLGVSLGDRELIVRAARNAVAGLFVGVLAAVLIGRFGGVNHDSHELMSRIVVGLDSIALALAAGVAAALSIVAGVSTALVGVMVAVALLPPAAAAGLFLGAGELSFAARAGLLLVVNIICIMLAAQGVYLWKDVRPRTWLEKKSAEKAMRISAIALVVLLVVAAAIIVLAPTEVIPQNPLRDGLSFPGGG